MSNRIRSKLCVICGGPLSCRQFILCGSACRAEYTGAREVERYGRDREKRVAQRRKYVAANPEKVRAQGLAYRIKRREKQRAYARKYRVENHEKIRDSCRNSAATGRRKHLAALGGMCVRCGFDNPLCLEIDHRHDDGYKELSSSLRYGVLKAAIKNGTQHERHQILCSNCHRMKTNRHTSQRHKKLREAEVPA